MGSKGLKIVRGSFTGKYQKVGDTLLSAIEGDLKDQVSLQILPLKKKAESLISSFDSVLVTMNAILNENTRRNLMRSFESLKNTIVNLERTTFTLDTLMSTQKSKLALIFSNVESITYNLKNNNELIANVIKNFSNISDSLAKANVAGVVTKATSAIEQIDKIVNKINAGEGSLGMLLNNDTLYKNLQNSTYNLNRLLRDVRENPKRYLHFSALDLGRTVYILDPEDAAKYSEKKKKKKDKQEKLDKKLDE